MRRRDRPGPYPRRTSVSLGAPVTISDLQRLATAKASSVGSNGWLPFVRQQSASATLSLLRTVILALNPAPAMNEQQHSGVIVILGTVYPVPDPNTQRTRAALGQARRHAKCAAGALRWRMDSTLRHRPPHRLVRMLWKPVSLKTQERSDRDEAEA